ncbi:MAG: hypothetical protein U0K70_03910 [Acutalibacteraceae bacterium]|nr:hypothetical protein [Acutalibacteraceae bacterium]
MEQTEQSSFLGREKLSKLIFEYSMPVSDLLTAFVSAVVIISAYKQLALDTKNKASLA